MSKAFTRENDDEDELEPVRENDVVVLEHRPLGAH